MLPVADVLRDSAHLDVEIDFLLQDEIYNQNISELLHAADESTLDFGLPFSLDQPYPSAPRHLKLLTLYHLKHSKVSLDEYDALVCGIDGLPVRILSEGAERHGIPMFQLLVSLHDENADEGRSFADRITLFVNKIAKKVLIHAFGYDFLSSPPHPGGSHSGLIFVSGERTKQVLASIGVNEQRIVVTGVPRFEPLYKNTGCGRRRSLSDEQRILYLPSAFLIHGYEKLDQIQWHQIESIISWMDNTPTPFELIIKPHPRESDGKYKKLDQIDGVSVIPPDRDLYTEIHKSDVIVTIATTAAYEATLLRRPVIIGRFPASESFGDFAISDDFITVHSIEELESVLNRLRDVDIYNDTVERGITVAKEVIDPATPNSDEAIANRILATIDYD